MEYNVSHIKTMSFGRACNERLGMYLSADLTKALNLGVRELIYNSMDEFEMGYGDTITIDVNTKENIIKVTDNARGIPVGIREDGTNSLTAALTLPHTGGKMDSEVYASAVGLNGIGSKVVCHTAEWLKATIHTKGKIYFQSFHHTEEGAVADNEVKEIGNTNITGTIIEYRPATKTYQNNKINIEELATTLEELCYFYNNKKFILIVDGDKKTFLSKNGLADALAKKKAVHKNILQYRTESDGVKVELALQWIKENSILMPYANNLNVPEGGAFMTGFKTSLTKAFNSALGTNYSGEIIRKYLDGFVSVKVAVPQFSNQAKTALANPEARTACAKATTESIKDFFAKYPKDAEAIKELLEREQKAENAAQRAREAEKQVLSGQKKAKMLTNLPAKLADATGNGYKELFLTEGDSASSNLKSMRDPKTQGVLSLRGKVLNTHDEELAEIIKNKEIKDILNAIGCGVGSSINIKNSRYDKIIIATDQDSDGSHITILLMTLFLYHLRPLVEAGMIYKAMTPLYKIQTGKTYKYFYSDEELNDYAKKYGLPANYDRYKGLGALTPEQTEEVLANPDSRKIIQMSTDDMETTLKIYDVMMGNNLELRKQLVVTKGALYEQYK